MISVSVVWREMRIINDNKITPPRTSPPLRLLPASPVWPPWPWASSTLSCAFSSVSVCETLLQRRLPHDTDILAISWPASPWVSWALGSRRGSAPSHGGSALLLGATPRWRAGAELRRSQGAVGGGTHYSVSVVTGAPQQQCSRQSRLERNLSDFQNCCFRIPLLSPPLSECTDWF